MHKRAVHTGEGSKMEGGAGGGKDEEVGVEGWVYKLCNTKQ